ncbi:hypothetical protein GF324_02830, partial [bacterium]|nr:hypothetical protein [bacterium]
MKRLIESIAVVLVVVSAAVAQSGSSNEPPSLSTPPEAGGAYGAGGDKAIDARFFTERPMPLEQPVDPDTYVLGPGDELGIAIRGGVDGFFRLRVNPDGTLIVPLSSPVTLEGMVLTEARETLTQSVQESFPSATVDVVLLELRRFRVTIAGAISSPGIYEGSRADRASNLVERAGSVLTEQHWRRRNEADMQTMELSWAAFKTRYGEFPVGSQRRAVLHHKDGTSERVDLLRYDRTGDEKYNPTLRDGDRLV